MKKIRNFIVFAAAILLAVTACAGKKTYPKAPAYEGSPDKEFPIVASYAFYPPFITEQQFAWAREAGFNIIRKSLDDAQIDSCLTLAARNNMFVMVAPWYIRDVNKIPALVKKYGKNPNVWGYAVADEPLPSQFEDLGKVMGKIAELDPQKNGYINLLPSMSPDRLDAKSYKAYVEEYIETVNPPFLSFDCYPVRTGNNGQVYVDNAYFESLEDISAMSKASGRSFWSYVLCVKHWKYPTPKEAYIRFSVFSALAYGAQGLNYFTYLMPDFDKGKGEFADAPINWKGERTATWYMVKNVNSEVHRLADVFLGAEMQSVGFTGGAVPPGSNKLKKLPAAVKKIESDGAGLLVSVLKNGSREFLMIVNRDVTRSQNVTMTCTKTLTRLTGEGAQRPYNSTGFNLEPGGYAIFSL